MRVVVIVAGREPLFWEEEEFTVLYVKARAKGKRKDDMVTGRTHGVCMKPVVIAAVTAAAIRIIVLIPYSVSF